jgi:hypothetical protein
LEKLSQFDDALIERVEKPEAPDEGELETEEYEIIGKTCVRCSCSWRDTELGASFLMRFSSDKTNTSPKRSPSIQSNTSSKTSASKYKSGSVTDVEMVPEKKHGLKLRFSKSVNESHGELSEEVTSVIRHRKLFAAGDFLQTRLIRISWRSKKKRAPMWTDLKAALVA